VTAVVIYAAGIISDLTAANRTLLEEVRTRLLRAEVERARSESVRTGADARGDTRAG
jgi:hypothetical protein